jgi:hypothetical protein
MKHPAIIPSLCALFGFLFAWFIKPTAKTQSTEITNPIVSSSNTNAGLGTSSRKEPKSSSFDLSTHTAEGVPLPPELIEARAQLANTARNSLALKDQGFVQRLTELLGLTIEQQQHLLQLYQKKRDDLNIYAPGKNIDPRRMLEEAEVVEKRFNESLAQVLDSEQITKLNDFRKQQASNRALATAQKEFADVLEKIDLSPDQQSAVLTLLHQNASTTQSQVLDRTGLYAETFDAMGFGSAGDAMSLVSAANTSIHQSSDKAAMIETIVQARKNSTAQKIGSLRTILTPAQLSQYTSVIEARDQSFYTQMAPMMQGPPPEGLIEK